MVAGLERVLREVSGGGARGGEEALGRRRRQQPRAGAGEGGFRGCAPSRDAGKGGWDRIGAATGAGAVGGAESSRGAGRGGGSGDGRESLGLRRRLRRGSKIDARRLGFPGCCCAPSRREGREAGSEVASKNLKGVPTKKHKM